MPNPINIKEETEKIHQLWTAHYGRKNAWLLSREVRKLFRAENKKKKKKKYAD